MKKIVFVLYVCVTFIIAVPSNAQNTALNSIHLLAQSNAYITYISIGSIADGHLQKIYEPKVAIDLMKNVRDMTVKSMEALQSILNTGLLSQDDFKGISTMIETFQVLKNEAESYQKYVETGDIEFAKLYENYRNDALAKLIKWLKIEE